MVDDGVRRVRYQNGRQFLPANMTILEMEFCLNNYFNTRFDSEMHEDEEEEEAGQVGEQQVLYFLSVSTATYICPQNLSTKGFLNPYLHLNVEITLLSSSARKASAWTI